MADTNFGFDERRGAYRWCILIIFLLSQLVLSIAGYGWGPLAPFFKNVLRLSGAQIGGIGSAFYFAAALSALPSGIIVDRFGVKKGMLMWLCITGAPLLLIGIFKVPYLFLLFLISIAGAGYGIGNPVSSKGLYLWFDQTERATVFGIKQAAVTVGAAVAGVLLVYLSQRMGPFSALLLVSGVIFLMASAAYIWYRDPIPLGEAALPSPSSLIELLRGFKGMLGCPEMINLSLAIAMFGFAQGIVVTFLVLYLSESLSFSLVAAGSCQTIVMISGAAGRVIWGLISDRIFAGARQPVLIIIAALVLLSSSALAFWKPAWPRWGLILVIIFVGLSSVGWNSVALILAAEISDPRQNATAVGFVSTAAWLGLSIGPVVFGILVDYWSYDRAWTTLAVVSLGIIVTCLRLGRKKSTALYTGK
jgi:sugar phosphate permease